MEWIQKVTSKFSLPHIISEIDLTDTIIQAVETSISTRGHFSPASDLTKCLFDPQCKPCQDGNGKKKKSERLGTQGCKTSGLVEIKSLEIDFMKIKRFTRD